jgi:hypothetical protein
VSRSIENAARQRRRTTPGPDQGPVPSRSSAHKGSAFPVHHLRSRRRRPQGAAWALGGQEARERAGRAWRIGAGASREEADAGGPDPASGAWPRRNSLPAETTLQRREPARWRRRGWTGLCGDASPSVPGRRCHGRWAGERQRERPIATARGTNGRAPLPSSRCRQRGAAGTKPVPPLPPAPDRHSDEPRPASGARGGRAPASRAGSATGRRAGAGPSLWTIALHRILPLDGGHHTVDE